MSILPSSTRARFWSGAMLLLALWPALSFAQSGDGFSAVELTSWPDVDERRNLEYEILPFIDWMRLNYRAGEAGGRPDLSLTLEWHPEDEAIYEGRVVRVRDIPGTVHLVAIDLRAGVYLGGQKVADFTVVVDSMISTASPATVDISLPDLDWENVFSETSAEDARRIFDEGFELRDLEIASAAFAVIADASVADAGEPATSPRARRNDREAPAPVPVSVYRGARAVDVILDIFWIIGPRPHVWAPDDGERRTAIGRGSDEPRSRAGRGSSGRSTGEGVDTAENGDSADRDSGERERKRKAGGFRLPESSGDDDDDDEDDSKLVPYAIAAVAAAGVLAAAGGTLGYYGSSRHAPFGVTSGLVRRSGGLLLQVGVNEALLFNQAQPKKLVVKMLSFGNYFRSNIEPALGGGVLAMSDGGSITYEPSISFGAVAQYRMFLFYGGYDFWQQGAEFGAAFNFRELFKRSGESPRP